MIWRKLEIVVAFCVSLFCFSRLRKSRFYHAFLNLQPTLKGYEMINRAKLRGQKLDDDCKRANTTNEADLCVCYGLIDNAENLLPKCQKCKALVWNAEKLIIKRMKEDK